MTQEPLNLADLDIRRLKPNDDVAEWRCGEEPWAEEVAEFLRDDAINQEALGLNVTLVFVDRGQIAGFVALLGGTLRKEDEPALADALDVGYSEFPCLKIGQFGVHADCHRVGLGAYMMEWLRIEARAMNVGFRFLSLHVRNDNGGARRFWTREGFWPIQSLSGSNYQFMVYDLYQSAS